MRFISDLSYIFIVAYIDTMVTVLLGNTNYSDTIADFRLFLINREDLKAMILGKDLTSSVSTLSLETFSAKK